MPPGAFRMALAVVVILCHISALAIGSACVYLFFMLSGYWIWRMWFKEYQPLEKPWRVFVTSRIWRLMPCYYAVLVLLLLCIPLHLFHMVLPTSLSAATAHFLFFAAGTS